MWICSDCAPHPETPPSASTQTSHTVQAQLQEDLISTLRERLEDQDVPVEKVSLRSENPLQIEIVLRSASSTDRRAVEDLWFEHVAYREAMLAHRLWLHLYSFRIEYENTEGKTIDWTDYYVPKEPIQGMTDGFSYAETSLNDEKSRSEINNRLDLNGLALDELEVRTFEGPVSKSQIVNLKVSASNLDAANSVIAGFILSLKSDLEQINKLPEINIAICRLWLIDRSSGKSLLSYIWDLELGKESWLMVDGLSKDWFPHPPSESNEPLVVPSETPIVPKTNPALNGPYPPPVTDTVPLSNPYPSPYP